MNYVFMNSFTYLDNVLTVRLLVHFWRFCKAAKRDCQRLRPSAWNNTSPARRICHKFYIGIFTKICRESLSFMKLHGNDRHVKDLHSSASVLRENVTMLVLCLRFPLFQCLLWVPWLRVLFGLPHSQVFISCCA